MKNHAVKCSTCGKFMRRLGLITRIRLEVECDMKRTHWCSKEEFDFITKKHIHH